METASAVLRDLLDIKQSMANKMITQAEEKDLNITIMKFGGSSVATGEKIKNVAKLIANNYSADSGIVIIVSALEGITNQLIQAAEEAKKGEVAAGVL